MSQKTSILLPRWRGLRIAAIACVAGMGAAIAAQAQTMTGVPNALQGFSKNRDLPVQIEAQALEVRDKEQQAQFVGNVKVTQGDTVMRAKSLVVFYDRAGGKGTSALKAAQPGPGGSQRIKRLEARGGVKVTQKNQTVTGARGIFDMRANTVTLEGGVVLTQGDNVLRGERLIVDLRSGAARVEAGKSSNGRVQGLFRASGNGVPQLPGANPAPIAPPAAAGKPSGQTGAAPAPGQPLQLGAPAPGGG